jgi:branched-chain amino acid aminotransferase
LPFGYIKKQILISVVYIKMVKWGKLEISSSEYIDIHIAATGTALWTGGHSKDLRHIWEKDGKIRLFPLGRKCKKDWHSFCRRYNKNGCFSC